MLQTKIPNILIVDDNLNNLNVLAGMLSERDYKVRRAINGTIALKALKASKPDLILLDINLPDLSGYEICTTLQEDPQTADIPVIFISALNGSLDKLKAYSVGGVDYVSKPFEMVEVLARIDLQLQLQLSKLTVVALRDPLERLKTCSQSLDQDYSSTLDTQGQSYVQHIKTDSQYLTQAIDDLHQKLHCRPVD